MQKLQLSIPQPCHENWHHMTPSQQGRFCQACAKEVVDFSMMTDTEILNYFSALTHEKVCGRALQGQLERDITWPKEPKKRLFWYWNYVVMFFMFFGKGNNAKAQCDVKMATGQSNLIRSTNMNNALAGKVGEVAINNDRVINGKVSDIGGNPVSFASVIIKGTNNGTSADANGMYSLKVRTGAILGISGAGFKSAEISTGNESVFNTMLETLNTITMGETIIVGSIRRDPDEYFGPYDRLKRVAVIQVKDETTGKAIPHANLVIQDNNSDRTHTFITDKRGLYKIKGITEYDEYEIKVSANGYEPGEFTINETDFKDRKKEWEVLLTRRKTELPVTKPTYRINCPGATVQAGDVSAAGDHTETIYVVDGIIDAGGKNLNPEDIDDITILQNTAAVALFGPRASNGAIVITTRKAKVKMLDTVAVMTNMDQLSRRLGGMSMGVRVSRFTDVKARLNTLLTDSLKIYPNPVQRGTSVNIAIKLKEAGNHYIQVSDASGRIILQKKITALIKVHSEKFIADSKWSGGVYHIRVFDNKNQLISKSSFIVR